MLKEQKEHWKVPLSGTVLCSMPKALNLNPSTVKKKKIERRLRKRTKIFNI
jgi:hypothetical protein